MKRRRGKYPAIIADVRRTAHNKVRVVFVVQYADGPRVVTRDFTTSLGKTSCLRKFLVELGFENEIASRFRFDLVTLVGKKITVKIERKILASRWEVESARAA